MAELCGCRDQSGGGQRHANLFEIAGRHLAIGELQEAFKTGFAQAFSREIADGQLTDYEMREARRLKANYTAVAPLGTGTVSGEVAFA